jgi:iron complex outermembrane receptor protein
LLACGALGALVTAVALSAPASAQTAATATPDAKDNTTTVVVTGIRRGIQSAITAKKKSAQIVEAVSAEDIGKLPDASIAESIARLPGIAAQRTNGRAQTLSIRGLGPDYTVTTLNGREQVSTNDNRSVEFDQYPSELISQVVVYKTPNAGMTDQGLAGTADLQTVRPLSYGKPALGVNFRREENSEPAHIGGMKNTGDRYSINYINQFFDRTVGIALGYAHTDSPYQTLKKESWGYPTCSACLPADQSKLITGGEKDAVDSSNLGRDGYMGVLEWKPNDRLHMTFDGYHSDYNELQRIARLEYPLAWGANQLQPGYTSNATFITHGVFTGVKTVVENYINQRKDKLDAFGWNTEYQLNDKWSLMSDLSASKVARTDVQVESTAGTGSAGQGPTDTVTFDQKGFGLTNISSTLNYSDFNSIFLTDPNGWGGTDPTTGAGRAGYLRLPHITDEINAIKLQATRKLGGGFFSDVSFGYAYDDHAKHKQGIEGELYLKGNSSTKTAVVPSQYRTGVTDASFLGNGHGMISYDALALYESGFFDFTEETCQACVAKTWNVDEKLSTAYVKADIDSHLFGVPMTGNMGLQSIHVDQKSSSYFTDGTATGETLVSGGTSYTDVLPTLNLNFTLADDTTLRFGAGTSVARPRMDDMAGGVSYGVTNDNSVPPQGVTINGHPEYWSGSGGNPHLKPWKANNYDLSLEKYFGRKGYLSVAVFYKDLTRFVYNQSVLRDFTGVALPSNSCAAPATCTLANQYRQGYVTAPANGSGGHIQGVELTASLPGELVTPWLDGFGVIWSASLNQSEMNPGGLGKIDVPGLSRSVVNTTLYYEKHGWSFRVSDRYRGDFLGEVPDYTNSLTNTWVHNESVIDAQISYEIQDGPAKGLNISLSGSNLNNEPFYTYQGKGHPDQILRYEKYGSTYLLGLSYKFF